MDWRGDMRMYMKKPKDKTIRINKWIYWSQQIQNENTK